MKASYNYRGTEIEISVEIEKEEGSQYGASEHYFPGSFTLEEAYIITKSGDKVDLLELLDQAQIDDLEEEISEKYYSEGL